MWCDDYHFEEHFDKDARLMFRNEVTLQDAVAAITIVGSVDSCGV